MADTETFILYFYVEKPIPDIVFETYHSFHEIVFHNNAKTEFMMMMMNTKNKYLYINLN